MKSPFSSIRLSTSSSSEASSRCAAARSTKGRNSVSVAVYGMVLQDVDGGTTKLERTVDRLQHAHDVGAELRVRGRRAAAANGFEELRALLLQGLRGLDHRADDLPVAQEERLAEGLRL